MATVTINCKALKAVSRFAAVKDVRFYLVGVYVESNSMQTRLAASDGHTMAVYRDDRKGENHGEFTGIIPAYVVKAVLGWKCDTVQLFVPDDYDASGEAARSELHIRGDAFSTTFKALDGRFPDYRRIIPGECEEKIMQFNPEYQLRIWDAARDIYGKKAQFPCMAMDGKTGAGFAAIGSSMVCVIMSMRANAPAVADIQWAKKSLPFDTAPVANSVAQPEAITA